MKHFVFTGGGTGGHVVPNLPIIERLRAAGHRVTYVGSRSGYEERLVAGAVDAYVGVPAGKLRRYWSFANVLDAFRVLAGVVASVCWLGRLRPDAVFSKGGFVSLPVVFAAWLWRVPVVAHESDSSPGLANRLAYPFLRHLCLNFPVDGARLGFRGPVTFTGTPLRATLRNGSASRGRAFLKVPAERPIILITGGSLGADRLNEVVLAAAPTLTNRYALVHACGPGKCPPPADWPPGYQAFEYLTEPWGDVLAAASLVVSRAGANTLFELLALRKPHLLVPLSRRVSRGDQIENAEFAAAAGYSAVLPEENLTPATLIDAIDAESERLNERQAAMNRFTIPPATEQIAAMLLDLGGA